MSGKPWFYTPRPWVIDTELGPGSPGSTSGCLFPNRAAMNKLPNHCTLQFLYLKNGILSISGHSEFKPLSEGGMPAG